MLTVSQSLSKVGIELLGQLKIKIPPQHVTGGHLGRIYPEGEDDLTSLGGR